MSSDVHWQCHVDPRLRGDSVPHHLQAALDDFRARIRKYEEVYETITNRDLHYIKLIDMCAVTLLCVTLICTADAWIRAPVHLLVLTGCGNAGYNNMPVVCLT